MEENRETEKTAVLRVHGFRFGRWEWFISGIVLAWMVGYWGRMFWCVENLPLMECCARIVQQKQRMVCLNNLNVLWYLAN